MIIDGMSSSYQVTGKLTDPERRDKPVLPTGWPSDIFPSGWVLSGFFIFVSDNVYWR